MVDDFLEDAIPKDRFSILVALNQSCICSADTNTKAVSIHNKNIWMKRNQKKVKYDTSVVGTEQSSFHRNGPFLTNHFILAYVNKCICLV